MTADKVILGENCEYSADSTVTGLNNNKIVCGPSGCGKTMSIAEPSFLETWNSSRIVTVTKRRIVRMYKQMYLKRGYDFQDLNFVHPLEGNTGYDPLQYVSSYADITYLARSIVMSNPKKGRSNSDVFWDDAATSLLSALICYTMMTKDEPTFADVLNMLDHLTFSENCGQIDTNYDGEFEYLESRDASCFAVTCWKSFHQNPIKTASCIFSTLNSTIDTIFSPEVRKIMTMKKKVDFEKLASSRTILFVTTSPVNTALHCFVNMFYGHVFKQLFEFAESLPDGRLPLPVDVLCDDFATGSPILNFAEYISIFREKRISVTLLLQSESQLESMYGPGDAATIINNCDTYIYMGGMDLQTARNMSLRLDVPLNEVLYMPLGQEIIIRRGQKPIVTKRYNILENELYKKITRTYRRSIARQEEEGSHSA